jgi:hypothetical protein
MNARLKDEFGGWFLCVRGDLKARCHLMSGILVHRFVDAPAMLKPGAILTACLNAQKCPVRGVQENSASFAKKSFARSPDVYRFPALETSRIVPTSLAS